jgi:DNA-binding transcriptional LysR family regulator
MDCRVTTTSALAIMHWAIAGVGIARMPRRTVQAEIDRGTLVQVLPAYTPLGFPVFAVYMPERFRPANVRRLIDHATAWFGGSFDGAMVWCGWPDSNRHSAFAPRDLKCQCTIPN